MKYPPAKAGWFSAPTEIKMAYTMQMVTLMAGKMSHGKTNDAFVTAIIARVRLKVVKLHPAEMFYEKN